ncbi:hypothetical protein MTBLM1_90072 [Rhodospirillaceae bacterium LM-1]|nr:hypothetical protein MTBLM1_90072 [Rhodospirillaceae bacterium LM-1]
MDVESNYDVEIVWKKAALVSDPSEDELRLLGAVLAELLVEVMLIEAEVEE